MNDFISVDEAAKIIGLHPITLRRYIKEGKLKAKKFGKAYRIKQSDFDAFSHNSEDKQIISTPLPPPHHSHKHTHIIPGLNSLLTETLFEIKDTIKTTAEIETIITDIDRDYLPLFQQVKKDYPNITNPIKFILEFAKKESSVNKEIRKTIIRKLQKKQIAVFLPLPPYVYDSLYLNIPDGYLFNTEERPPHHLEKAPFESVLPHTIPAILKKVGKLPVIIVDGQKIGNKLMIRSNVATILSYMMTQNLQTIYFHKIPHIPKKQHFTLVTPFSSISIITL